MSEVRSQPYTVRKVSVIAKGADVLVREYVLDPGEFIPWHHHTAITDRFYGLEGLLRIETRASAACYELKPGDAATVVPPTPHRVSNAGDRTCRFLLVQGVGKYDFVREE